MAPAAAGGSPGAEAQMMAPKRAEFSLHHFEKEPHGRQAPGRPLPNATVAKPALGRQLRGSCSSYDSCESCNNAWPSCAWCGTTAQCLDTTPELVAAGSRSEHVVYGREEYRRTYGGATDAEVASNACPLWVVNSASCAWVEGYCTSFRNAITCPQCKQLGGCGYCYKPGGQRGGCFSGSVSGPVRLSGSSSGCADPNEWIFGNWTRYYATEFWDHSCLESCDRYQARETGQSGRIRMGDSGSQVYYAPRSQCSWEIRPTPWPEDTLLEVILQYNSLAARGDLLRLSTSGGPHPGAPWSADQLVTYVGCDGGSSVCIGSQSAFMDRPAVLTFRSMPRSSLTMGGVWSVTWRMVPATTEGISIRSFVWMGLAMVLIPMLTILLWAIWCRRRYRRRGSNFGSSLEREGVSASAEAVDLGQLETQNPECKPRIIESNVLVPRETNLDNTADEVGSSGEATCSVCLRELAVGDEARSLPCGHHFHRPCIDLWLGRSTRCPLCRQPVMKPSGAQQAGATPPVELTTLRASATRHEEAQPVTLGRRQDAVGT